MIAVIADDFTGAAEIGGIGLRYGLKVIIKTNLEGTEECDLLIIASDTRSLPIENACLEIKKITAYLLSLKPKLIFKKIDSVLRGNIEHELVAQMKVMEKDRAIVIAGNFHFNRLIKNGLYYVNNQHLSDTFFANDPEFPMTTSSVLAIVRKGTITVNNCKASDALPALGLIIGDVICEEDLKIWANNLDKDSIAAGSAVFFNEVLKKYHDTNTASKQSKVTLREKSLFIFGSKFPKNETIIGQMNASDMDIINMPQAIFRSKETDLSLINDWSEDISKRLERGKKVAVTATHQSENQTSLSKQIKKNMGLLVSNIVSKTSIDDLLIEGGATTFAILNQLKIFELYPIKEIEPGVIQMTTKKFPNLNITTKPGSYLWPDEIWFSRNRIP